jgi:anti-anti-sigma factor
MAGLAFLRRLSRPISSQEALVFTLNVHHDADYSHLRLQGELDLHTCHLFRDRLTELVHGAQSLLVLDLTELQFIDSSGLGALLILLRVPEAQRPRIVLAPSNRPVARLLRTTRIDLLLTIHPSLESALAERTPARSAA